ncbi:class II aldolase/adducin family protein [Mesorhizobium sp. IMUNJ 23232]|uniref:class II aldolase/adducin family protein n=1 Tax=Mesorhizobium sp. IMUNJ 23232 TaxID=3376064 RepID=UPI0037B60ADF
MDDFKARRAILDVVVKLENKGFNHVSTGNVSCRAGGGILITPTGGNSANTTPERIVRLDDDGKVIGGGVPSSEWHMHTSILRAFPVANAVVHTHADACVALSCLRKPLPAFHYMVAGFGGNDVRCARYATFGTADLALSAVEALRDRTACLLANHGMIAMGKTLEAALNTTIKLETLARQYLTALQSGEPVLLSPEEMERVGRRYGNYGVGLLPG